MDKRKKKYLIAIVIIIIILAGGFLFYRLTGQKGSNQKFRLVKVERGEINFVVTATGTINPVINVLVGSQVSGTIKALYADFNSQVKEGQVIAQIDPAIFEAQVEQGRANVLNAQANIINAKANLENAKANLVKAEVAVLDAKRTLDRNRPLVEKKVIAQATMDTAQTNYDTAVAQTDVAKAQSGIGRVSGGIFKGSGGAGQGCSEGVRDQLEVCDDPVSSQWNCHFEKCRCGPNRGGQSSGSNPFYHC